jgi:hypothetical protein
MKLVTVFARPIGVSLQVIGHRGRVDSGGNTSVEAFGKISAFQSECRGGKRQKAELVGVSGGQGEARTSRGRTRGQAVPWFRV